MGKALSNLVIPSNSELKYTGSSDSKSKKDSRNKSMFTSLFKKNVKETTPIQRPQSERATIDPKLTNVEYKFRQEERVIDKDTIIIPLHSPDEVVEPLIRYEPGREQNNLNKERISSPQARQETSESQRTSLEVHTIEKNIVVVDVINEDIKDMSKSEPKTSSESKKVLKETKRRVDELEVYDYEPRVRRSSSICSRETDAVAAIKDETKVDKEAKDKEIQVDEREILSKTDVVDQKFEKDEKDRKSGSTDDTLSKSESGETCRQASQETVIENHLAKEDDGHKDKSPVQEDILSAIIHDEEIESLIKRDEDSENNITKSESHERRSSESEAELDPGKETSETDEERKGLFHQPDSMDDELPYVPTTLPQERSVAVPIIPIRQRVSEVKTCPVERPRSTTPIQPANLEEYAAFHEPRPVPQEKMQITLPRSKLR